MEYVSESLFNAWLGTLAMSAALLVVLLALTLAPLIKRLRRP